MFIAGWIVSALPIMMLGVGGVVMLVHPQAMNEGLKRVEFPISRGSLLAILEISCAALYFIPPTAILGAILLTGYLGGAVACHLRVGQDTQWIPAVVAGVLVWLGLFLRDARVRTLIPIRR